MQQQSSDAPSQPDRAPPCGVIETHISTLFLTPDRVYKAFKPIRTGFLDHTDPARRIADATAELALNRRLSPDVYLGTADVREADRLVDRLIVMRRLPDERRLSALVASPTFDDHLRNVARAVATFHAGLPPVMEPVPLATADGLADFWRSSIDDMAPLVGSLFDPDEYTEVARLAFDYLAHRTVLFEARREGGFVRDGHGDLIADDIFMLDDGPRILDCLAFADEYRVSDVLADIAFLVMDVERLAGQAAARSLLRWYCEFTNEHHPPSLAHHYVAYRAHVRAKVAALRHQQGDPSAAADARRHHRQACDHLRRSRVTMLLLGGGPGTGKSTLADSLSDILGWSTVDSDTLRKDMARVDHDDHRVELHPDLYGDSATEDMYRQLIDHASSLLAAGESVIVDASWAREAHRELARLAANRHGAHLIEIQCGLDPDLARQRIRARQRAGSAASDATPDLIGRPQDAWPAAMPLDTAHPVEDLCTYVVACLRRDLHT
jgi:aminoglycoside phosphotransferase family enzyme/predicted kinase